MNIPDRVRADARFVMEQAQFVRINAAALGDYAARLVAESKLTTTLDGENHFVGAAPEKVAAYVLALDSINFGSGTFRPAQAAGLTLEYDVVAKALKASFVRGEYADPAAWTEITAADCHRIFALPAGRCDEVDWLMREFARHLRDSAACLARDFGGIGGLLAAKGGQIVETVAAWPHFRDVAQYGGREIGIFKRAQILLADLELALGGFGGIENLTCFADNMVPHVLRCEGVLDYAPDLAARIDGGQEIAQGSVEETELRCAAIAGVSAMAGTLSGYTEVNLDHMIWHRGYEKGFFGKPPHRTISTWY